MYNTGSVGNQHANQIISIANYSACGKRKRLLNAQKYITTKCSQSYLNILN